MKKQVEALFKKEKRRLIKKFGRVPLTNIQIDKFCSKELGAKYKGSYAVDEQYQNKLGMMVINTDTQTGSPCTILQKMFIMIVLAEAQNQ